MQTIPQISETASIIQMYRDSKLDLLKQMVKVHDYLESLFVTWYKNRPNNSYLKGDNNFQEALDNFTAEVDENILMLKNLRIEIEYIDQRSYLIEEEVCQEIKDTQGLSSVADDIRNSLETLFAKSTRLETKISEFKGKEIPCSQSKEDYFYHAVLDFRRSLERFGGTKTPLRGS